MADQRPLSERFPLDEWIEAVENLVTQMGYEDWCEFRRIQEDEKPDLAEVWFLRRIEDGHIYYTNPLRSPGREQAGHQWVKFVEAPF